MGNTNLSGAPLILVATVLFLISLESAGVETLFEGQKKDFIARSER